MLAHYEPFYLIELNLRPRRDLLIAKTHPRQCDADRRRVVGIHRRIFTHRVDLPRRGVCPQENRVITAPRGLDEERILHIAGRMVRREIQQLKIVFVRFHFARGVHLKAHIRENAHYFSQLLCGRMQPSHMDSPPRQCDIQRVSLERLRQRRLFHEFGALLQRGLERQLHTVRRLTHGWPLLLREFPQLREDRHQRGGTSHMRHTPRLQRRRIRDGLQRLQRGSFDFV